MRTTRAVRSAARAQSAEELESTQGSARRRTPYSGLPAHHFWKGAVSDRPAQDVDPVVSVPFLLSRTTRVATAGSCFAQNISTTLQRHGFNYYIAETTGDMPPEEARKHNYGVFSARFGNLYTARQLLQLTERAYGGFVPAETHWQRPDG